MAQKGLGNWSPQWSFPAQDPVSLALIGGRPPLLPTQDHWFSSSTPLLSLPPPDDFQMSPVWGGVRSVTCGPPPTPPCLALGPWVLAPGSQTPGTIVLPTKQRADLLQNLPYFIGSFSVLPLLCSPWVIHPVNIYLMPTPRPAPGWNPPRQIKIPVLAWFSFWRGQQAVN